MFAWLFLDVPNQITERRRWLLGSSSSQSRHRPALLRECRRYPTQEEFATRELNKLSSFLLLIFLLTSRNVSAQLGEDRYLTTLMLRTFPRRKMMFCPQAVCKTIVPDTFGVLLSQRRRWINSTVHNLFELIVVPDLCGVFCFSMRFVSESQPSSLSFSSLHFIEPSHFAFLSLHGIGRYSRSSRCYRFHSVCRTSSLALFYRD